MGPATPTFYFRHRFEYSGAAGSGPFHLELVRDDGVVVYLNGKEILRDSMPEGVFDRAAVRAAEKWEFEPVIEDGQAVEKRAGVRMMFALE